MLTTQIGLLDNEELLELEGLLQTASEWGLRNEVEKTAQKYIDEGHSVTDSFHWAFEDWVK